MIWNDPMLRKEKARKVTLTLEGTGNINNCYIEIGGVRYYSAQTLKVKSGTEIYCYAISTEIGAQNIYLNGVGVGESYQYVATSHVKINLEYSLTVGPGGIIIGFGSRIDITESPSAASGSTDK